MDNQELVRCGRCFLPIHPDDTKQYMGTFATHDPNRCVQLLRAALESAEKDGFVLVPREPTHQMVEAGTMAGIAATWKEDGPVADARNLITAAVYKGMLDAALSAKGSA